MKPTTPAQRRNRRGQPDRLVDPETSAKRRAAAAVRWRGAAEPAAREDAELVDHLHAKLIAGRLKGAELLAAAQPEVVKITVSIAKDTGAPAAARLRACELIWTWAGVSAEVQRVEFESRDVSELTLEEIQECSRQLAGLIAARRLAEQAARHDIADVEILTETADAAGASEG
jgi:hypothetical protein